MYAFVDRQLDELDEGGRFLLHAVRGWARERNGRRPPDAVLVPLFRQSGVKAAWPSFNLAMTIIAADALLPFRFAATRYDHVTDDEAIILQIFQSLQSGDVERVRETVALLVTPERRPVLLSALTQVSRRLASTGLSPAQPVAR